MTEIVTPRDDVLTDLCRRNPAEIVGDVIVVRTDVLLASGDQCVVVVEGGGASDRVTVSDAGGVLISLAEAGFELCDRGYARIGRAARKSGLHLVNGVLRSRPYAVSEAPQAVVSAANAMRHILVLAFDIARGREKSRYRERIEKQLAPSPHG